MRTFPRITLSPPSAQSNLQALHPPPTLSKKHQGCGSSIKRAFLSGKINNPSASAVLEAAAATTKHDHNLLAVDGLQQCSRTNEGERVNSNNKKSNAAHIAPCSHSLPEAFHLGPVRGDWERLKIYCKTKRIRTSIARFFTPIIVVVGCRVGRLQGNGGRRVWKKL